MAESDAGRKGLGRLVVYSLGAAVLTLVVTKLRRRSTAGPIGENGDGPVSESTTQSELRKRLTALPGGRTEVLAKRPAPATPEPTNEPSTNPDQEHTTADIARPVMPIASENPDASPISRLEPTVSTPNGNIVQAAVETTELDPFAWPEPPAPPPVVPADTTLSTLVNDATDPATPAAINPPVTSISSSATSSSAISSSAICSNAGENAVAARTAGSAETNTLQPPASSATTGEPAKSGPFYGWFLVAAVFVILCITSGVGFYNASVILSAATRELGASVGAVSGATGLFFAIGGLTGFTFAKRMEFVDIRWFFVAGGLVGGAALLGLRWVTSIPALYIFFAFFGVAFGLAGLVPATTLITRWFDRRRSVALSIASTGLSMGGIVVTPFSDWLIDQRTLSGAAPFLAAIWVIGVIPMAVLFVRSYPSDKGLRPDGDPSPTPTATQTAEDELADGTPAAVPGLSFARARNTRFFVALCLAYAVIFFGQVGGIAQLFNMILERTDNPTARTALATLAGSSVVFRLLGGAAVIRLPTQSFSAVLAVIQAAALILLAVTNSSTGLILSAAFFGCSIGNLLMLQPLLLAEAFGVANYGRIYSFNQLFGTIGLAGGPLTLGLIHDVSDYRTAFFVAAGASFIGCLAIVAAGPITKVQVLWR